MTARSLLLLIPLILIAGCSRGGAFVPPATSYATEPGFSGAAKLTATFSILVPKSKPEDARSAGLLHQDFVAATTKGALVRAYHRGQHAHPVASIAVNLSATSRDCKRSARGRTCTFALAIPATGTYQFVVDTYNQPPKRGKFKGAFQLGIGIATAKITKSRTIKLVIGGVVAGTAISTSSGGPFSAIDPLSQVLSVETYDADNNAIVTDTFVDKNGKPVTIRMTADSAAGTTMGFTPASFDKPTTDVTLKYTPYVMNSTQAQSGFATSITAKASNGGSAVGVTLSFSQPQLTFYSITSGSSPQSITAGPDGALWFAEASPSNGQIVRITTSGVFTNEFPLSASEADPRKIITGPNKNLWFTAQAGNSIDQMTMAGVVTPYTGLTSGSAPEGITVGPDGNIWFTETGAGKIGHITTAQTNLVEITLAGGTQPHGIVTGPDGAMWFTDQGTSQIGRVPTSGSPVASYPSSPANLPYVIASGADGALWFGGCNPYIGEVTTTSPSVVPYTIGGTGEVGDITVGPDGAIWFSVQTSTGPQSIGRITPAAGIVLYYVPGTNPYPSGITKGPDGAIWFLELNANQVGKLQ